jgi:1-acyl-sn-glycerol-3-phosphate acyltransferase
MTIRTKPLSRAVVSLFLAGARRVGPDLVPPRGPCVVALKHVHELDGFLLDAFTRRSLHALADPRVAFLHFARSSVARSILLKLGVVCFDRDRAEHRGSALRAAVAVVGAGGALAIAPEGTSLHERRRGAATLAEYYGSIGLGGALREWLSPPLHEVAAREETELVEGVARIAALGARAAGTTVPVVPVGVAYVAAPGDARPRAAIAMGAPLAVGRRAALDLDRLRAELASLSRAAAAAW